MIKIPIWCWIITDGILFILNDIVKMTQIPIPGINHFMGLVLHVVGAIMAVSILYKIACMVSWKDNGIIKCLSKYSMPMYLFHQQIIYFSIVALNGKVNPWINAGVNFAVAVIGSLVISIILMHWKITRFLIGEK